MEHQLWRLIVVILNQIDKRPKRTIDDFGPRDIVRVWFWAVLHDRPVSWACRRQNWPLQERRRKLPSPSTMSRRLRSPAVRRLLNDIEEHVLRPQGVGPLIWAIDGKPLTISGCSKDRQAGYGRAASGKAKGYKLHAIISLDGAISSWRIAPMNKDEREMARRMLAVSPLQGYILADANYDSNPLHEVCEQRGDLQLVTPPRYGFCRGRGHRRQSAGRLRSIALLSNPQSAFGRELHQERNSIERHFGNLTNWWGGLNGLPSWVRTHRRVHRWVQAKLILYALKRQCRKPTYVAS